MVSPETNPELSSLTDKVENVKKKDYISGAVDTDSDSM